MAISTQRDEDREQRERARAEKLEALHETLTDLGNGLVAFVPQVPQGQSTVQGRAIQLGNGSADVLATHTGNTYSTDITTTGVGTNNVVIGHTLPRGTKPAAVVLDGKSVNNYTVVQTNRGSEVTIPTSAGHHTLTITT